MASNETGKCCVCGRETTQKCSACAEANFSLFFCSREHQKLIWPVHKLVCGPGRCSPFLWPKLTKYEAEEAKQHFDTPYDPSTPSSTLSTRLVHDNGVPADGCAAFLGEITEGRPSTLSPADEQFALSVVRTSQMSRRLDTPGALLRTSCASTDAMRRASYAVWFFDTPLRQRPGQARRAWSTRACHLLIEIAVELMRDANTDRQKEKSFFRHNSYTSQRLNKHLRGVVLP
ncbi:hypothetical protein JCM10213_006692, partial [Rhodosporidiobolus nylandii]